MPSQPTSTQIRFNNIIIGLTGVVTTLEVLAEAFSAPFLEPISRTSRSLLIAVQSLRTLHKIYTYVEAQRDKNKIQQFFQKGEMSTLLKACKNGIQDALEGLKVQSIDLLINAAEVQRYVDKRHEEVLQLIEDLSTESMSDRAPSVWIPISLGEQG
ncbi:hypothetical protein C8R43DRAFT_949899 [Mycena crocata]|nr:hypothetical protein C8R43DRAFT_949899 [Mycena crocata]